jgi:trehalose 6-phosphate synthase
VVSNRVADVSKASQSGGLAVALGDALRQHGGLWFGWDGEVVSRGTRVPPKVHTDERVTTITLPLTRKDHAEYYLGYSNSVLWPVCHYRLDLAEFQAPFLKAYHRVNSKFADALAPHLRQDDLIWVHDYHLIPLAAELRNRGYDHRMGFFLHIPFPPPEIMSATPGHERLVRALFSYDLVGFQTQGDVENFEQHVFEQTDAERRPDGLTAFDRTIRAERFPIGIDVAAFSSMARTRQATQQINVLRRGTASVHVIGVDRLDYSKGLPHRLRAFRRLLELNPSNQRVVTLTQIASPTREDVKAYVEIREELESLAGAINGEFGEFDWTPVRYIHRNVPRSTLAALYRGSQVGLVTPLRDGMNLVAKEYVAAQDESDPGVLILSKFAGAAEELEEALIVNPYNIDEVADALQMAIIMPVRERRKRHVALFEKIQLHNANNWAESFINRLADVRRGFEGSDITVGKATSRTRSKI